MKRFLCAVSIIALMSSCQKEEMPIPNEREQVLMTAGAPGVMINDNDPPGSISNNPNTPGGVIIKPE
jgi:hypothetical protein